MRFHRFNQHRYPEETEQYKQPPQKWYMPSPAETHLWNGLGMYVFYRVSVWISSIEGAQSASHLVGKRSADRAWVMMTDGAGKDDETRMTWMINMMMQIMHWIYTFMSGIVTWLQIWNRWPWCKRPMGNPGLRWINTNKVVAKLSELFSWGSINWCQCSSMLALVLLPWKQPEIAGEYLSPLGAVEGTWLENALELCRKKISSAIRWY